MKDDNQIAPYSKLEWRIVVILFFAAAAVSIHAQDRFPRPEFQSDYTLPQTSFPATRPPLFEWIDAAVLTLALLASSWLILRRRSRRAVFFLMLAMIAYFGFYRHGCICPVGSLQNVTAALFDRSFILPVTVVLFFTLPLLFALLFGRTFCASVCPLGGVQDLVALKPKRIPVWLDRALSLIPHLYLGMAVLFAATGAGFLICRFDPFVGIFRRSASFGMAIWGGFILLIGVFIARPYCRYLCPYGVLLGWMSRLSLFHATVTPDTCINCRLCEDACPYDAILFPVQSPPDEPRRHSVRRFLSGSMLVPLWILSGVSFGFIAHRPLADLHPHVHLAGALQSEERSGRTGETVETRTFRSGAVTVESQFERAEGIVGRFKAGSMVLGGYLGGVIALMFLTNSMIRRRDGYVPDRGRCLSCGRCFEACPQEQLRLTGTTAGEKHG